MAVERWKKCGASRCVKCFVSDNGRVISVKRGRVKILKQALSRKNQSSNRSYLVVHVGKTACVHRLVSDAFIGPLLPGFETKHCDDNTHNNHLSNLCHALKSIDTVHQMRTGFEEFKRSVNRGLTDPTILEEFHPIVWYPYQRFCLQCINDIRSNWESLSNSISSLFDIASVSSFFDVNARRLVALIKGDPNEEHVIDFPLSPRRFERSLIQKG